MEQSPLTIHKADHTGAIQVTYSGWLLDDSEAIVVLAQWQRPAMALPYVTFGQGDLLVETFYRERHYNIFALYDGSAAPPGADLAATVERLRLGFRQNNTAVAALEQLCPTPPSVCPLKGHYINFTYPIAYEYDLAGNQVAVKDPIAETTYFAYDALARLVWEQDPLGKTEYYGYDAVGNRLTQETHNASSVYAYDSANRLIEVDGVTYAWDTNGNLIDDPRF
jgi:YD repeat-containing protein